MEYKGNTMQAAFLEGESTYHFLILSIHAYPCLLQQPARLRRTSSHHQHGRFTGAQDSGRSKPTTLATPIGTDVHRWHY